jgi:pimeloyl-ACP methyl ester carboxylesterase
MNVNTIYKSESGRSEILSYYETLLEKWPKPYQKYCIPTRYGETFVLENGEKTAPSVVLLHGSSSNSAMWAMDVEVLSKKYRVLTIDIIGECGKSSEQRPSFEGDSYSDWIYEVYEGLGIKKGSLVGCSLGGWIATDFTIKHSEKVENLVLLATAGISPVRISTLFLIISMSLFGSWGFTRLNRLVYGNLEIDKNALEFAELIRKYFKPRTDQLPIFTNEQLKGIEAPVLFIGGENDCFYHSSKTAMRLAHLVKNFRADVLENTGHVLLNQANKISSFIS